MNVRTAATFLALAVLAGCASGGSFAPPNLTAPEAPASAPAASAPSPAAASQACGSKPAYFFRGPCAKMTLTAKGATLHLAPNHGYVFGVDVPANDLKNAMAFSFGDAVATQISGTIGGKSFPPYAGPGKALLYIVAVAPKPGVFFDIQAPVVFTLSSATAIAGKQCGYLGVHAGKWSRQGPLVKPAGNRLRFAFGKKGSELSLLPGKSYNAIYCI